MSAIGPGDLVYMAHRVCSCDICKSPVGIPFIVTDVQGDPSIGIRCVTTGKIVACAPVAYGFSDGKGHYRLPISALKKIPPGIVEDDVTTREEMPA